MTSEARQSKNWSDMGCHGLGVLDKVVPGIRSEKSFFSRLGEHIMFFNREAVTAPRHVTRSGSGLDELVGRIVSTIAFSVAASRLNCIYHSPTPGLAMTPAQG